MSLVPVFDVYYRQLRIITSRLESSMSAFLMERNDSGLVLSSNDVVEQSEIPSTGSRV